jgi:Pregnancy-associated plasma protein-A
MRMVRRTLTLFASVVFSLSLAVGPAYASAKSGLPAWACAPWESSTARGRLTDADGRVREMDTGQVATDLPARAKGKAPADFAVTVDVYFHVITDGGVGNLTARQIRSQIAVLNKTFGGREGGANTGFSFELAAVTRTDDAKWYAARGGTEHEFKKALKQGDDSDLNVYSTSGWLYLGWAYYPSITDTNQAYLDGIVLDWRSVPGASDAYEGRYDLGETLTHEAGHWLNLAHTFEGGCKEPGDFVADTPAQATPTSGCPAGKDTCPAAGLDPIHNYMDYSYDSCYTEFTLGQVQRARDAWLFYRAS